MFLMNISELLNKVKNLEIKCYYYHNDEFFLLEISKNKINKDFVFSYFNNNDNLEETKIQNYNSIYNFINSFLLTKKYVLKKNDDIIDFEIPFFSKTIQEILVLIKIKKNNSNKFQVKIVDDIILLYNNYENVFDFFNQEKDKNKNIFYMYLPYFKDFESQKIPATINFFIGDNYIEKKENNWKILGTIIINNLLCIEDFQNEHGSFRVIYFLNIKKIIIFFKISFLQVGQGKFEKIKNLNYSFKTGFNTYVNYYIHIQKKIQFFLASMFFFNLENGIKINIYSIESFGIIHHYFNLFFENYINIELKLIGNLNYYNIIKEYIGIKMNKKNIENKELDLILIDDNYNYNDLDVFKNLKKENGILCICNKFNSKQLFNLYIKDLNIQFKKVVYFELSFLTYFIICFKDKINLYSNNSILKDINLDDIYILLKISLE